MGQTAPPDPYAEVMPHYTCFVQAPSGEPGAYRVVELDGDKGGPIDRGVCVNLLEDAARVIQEEYMAKESGNMRDYAVLALAPALAE
jgi:ubiquitin carboxyl-terminal hydrolase L3